MALGATLTKNAKDIIPKTITNQFERESSTDVRTLSVDASKLSASQIINPTLANVFPQPIQYNTVVASEISNDF
ncbi:protein of unknown function [Limnospira indica PCC 8005]|uniref:Uncharacterized protein n=1 Tax=Limnospira indica PCC 8005 TaxID=376219 RepID=A0A9P1NZC7_9CYAN|nr:protein of unknown function [Limnospira indica PCC 8005]